MSAMQDIAQQEGDALRKFWEAPTDRKMHRRIRAAIRGMDEALDIIMEVRRTYGVTMEELQGPSRQKPLVTIRQECMAEIYRSAGMSLTDIGRLFCRDHSTVKHAINKSERRNG